MEQAAPIEDTDHYTSELQKSMIDKCFFLDKVDAGLFVDFGCADGALLGFIEKIYPDVTLIGYDNDMAMIERARERNVGHKITYTTSWNEVEAAVHKYRADGVKSCLVMSSVIHEAYSYLASDKVAAMWRRVWGDDHVSFDYVAIRDMMVSRSTSRASDPIQAARIRQLFDRDLLDDWEGQWGAIDENWSLVHLLLHYRYQASWKRESRENYLPVNFEDFISSVPATYFPVFLEHFTLPFLRRRVREDFGIELADRTHLKLVLERRLEHGRAETTKRDI